MEEGLFKRCVRTQKVRDMAENKLVDFKIRNKHQIIKFHLFHISTCAKRNIFRSSKKR